MASSISKDMIKAYTGEGDVVAWIKKVKLVAKLQKISDLASFLPLYLEGDALALYLEMTEDDQANADKIEARLKEAFTDGPFAAYGKLGRIQWKGEQVDVFANEIRRLAGLAGFYGESLERIVKLTFVNGFPGNISVELQQVNNIIHLSMSDILVRARVLTANPEVKVAAVASQAQGQGHPIRYITSKFANASIKTAEGRKFKGQCFRCRGPHMARFCKEKKTVVCFKCGEEGHISPQCQKQSSGTSQNQGNEIKGAGAPAATLPTE